MSEYKNNSSENDRSSNFESNSETGSDIVVQILSDSDDNDKCKKGLCGGTVEYMCSLPQTPSEEGVCGKEHMIRSVACGVINMDSFCFCKHARLILIVWAYIKLLLISACVLPVYYVLIIILFYGSQTQMIIVWTILISYPLALGFDIILIVAAHMQKVYPLKVCFYYLICELIVTVLLVPWIVSPIFQEHNMEQPWLAIAIETILLIAQGVTTILLLNSEVKKLSDVNGLAHEEVGYKNLKTGKETI